MTKPPTRMLGIQHVAIKVHDIDAAITFYIEVMGMRLSERHEPGALRPGSAGMAFMSCGRNHHDVNLVFFPKDAGLEAGENSRATLGLGLHHYAFLVCDKREFDAWVAHLEARGVQFVAGPLVHSSIHPEGDRTPGENRSVYFLDPSGNCIELCCEMGQMTEDNRVSMQWHAERLLRDGYADEAARVRAGADELSPLPLAGRG
jgi:catechol 2,3-dioxygenase-like lactoylglutathione lyase family enzyme